MLKMNPRVLYVDNHDCCEMIGVILEQEIPRIEMVGIPTAEKALLIVEKEEFDLFIFEYALPVMSGIDLCGRIREIHMEIPVLFYTTRASLNDRRRAMEAGATEYLLKPDDLGKLINAVKQLTVEPF